MTISELSQDFDVVALQTQEKDPISLRHFHQKWIEIGRFVSLKFSAL